MTTPPEPPPSAIEAHLGLEDAVPDDQARSTPDPETLAWADHLAPLYAVLPHTTPSAGLWGRIERSTVVRARRSFFARPVVWQALAAVFAAVSVGLALQLAAVRTPEAAPPPVAAPAVAPPPVLTAAMTGSAAQPGRLAFVMATSDEGAVIQSSPGTAQPVEGRSYNLWLVGPEYRVFVGRLDPTVQHSVPVPVASRDLVHEGARLEVSLDPGDTPPFQPGLIVASGQLSAVAVRS
jgi:anti-sigma-K factor RskA